MGLNSFAVRCPVGASWKEDCEQALSFLGAEALEFLKPIGDQGHFSNCLGLLRLELNHKEALPIMGDVIVPMETTRHELGDVKKFPWPAEQF